MLQESRYPHVTETRFTESHRQSTQEHSRLASRAGLKDGFQLALPLRWESQLIPVDPTAMPLSVEDHCEVQRTLASAVSVFAGRSALFALYDRVDDRTYSILAAQLRGGQRIPSYSTLRSVHGQYASPASIEAWSTAGTASQTHAVAVRLERQGQRWLASTLRLL